MLRLRRVALVVAMAALAVPGSASAHAILTHSDPADGSRIGPGTHVVRLWFNEKISSRFRSVRVVGPNGLQVAGVRVRGLGARGLAVDLPPLRNGTHAIVWRVLAEGDGHVTAGTLVLGVGAGAVPAGRGAQTEPRPSGLDVLLRWLRFSLVALLLGGVAFVAGPLRSAPHAQLAARRVLGLAAAGGVLALAVQAAVLVRETTLLASEGSPGSWLSTSWELLSASRWGHLWAAQEALLLILAGLALVLRGGTPAVPAPTAVAAGLAAVALAAVQALGSHAAGLPQTGFAVAVDAAHLLAASVWVGAVAAFAVTLWPPRRLQGIDGATLARPFAVLAGGSFLVVAVTGLYAAGLEVTSIDGLLTTLYGQALLTKTAIVIVVGTLGAANFVVLRSRSRSVARATVAAEVATGAFVLLAAGVLTASVPARGPQFAAPRPVHAPTLVHQADDLLLTVNVTPNRPGTNTFKVQAISALRPPPAPIASIALAFPPNPAPVSLQRLDGREWFGSARLDAAGDGRLALVVRRGGRDLTSSFRWRVSPPDTARPVVYSDRTLASIVDPAVIALLVLAVGLALAPLVRRALARGTHVPRIREESP